MYYVNGIKTKSKILFRLGMMDRGERELSIKICF